MKKGCKKFPLELKEKVLVASEINGQAVSSIATEYGVPEHTIRCWLRERKKLSSNLNQAHEVSKFVELSLEESVSQTMIKKASLNFRGISLTLEGNIKSTRLIRIIKILEKT